MQVLLTGANGFFGRNLSLALAERGHAVLPFTRQNRAEELPALVMRADAVVHLAGANRPADESGFEADNLRLAAQLAEAIRMADRPRRTLVFASSTQATKDNPYGCSKAGAEEQFVSIADIGNVAIFRFPNIFGKWALPYYNSAVATFCHCAARGEALPVNAPSAPLTLLYIDDAVQAVIAALERPKPGLSWPKATPEYLTSVGEIADRITRIASGREALMVGQTGDGLTRALYATYLSYLPQDRFSYPLVVRGDERGRFVEMVKSENGGQTSYFTQVPGVRRGGHYHHSKSEKFTVVRGHAMFRFRHLVTGERVDIEASAEAPIVVDTIPGWAHDVVNLSDEELIVLVWANEIFDRQNPDTISALVEP
ncbi:NAD-dependent epimerase/dehydratase family protein [Sandaracinobacter sp. RS1-74]|uniref:polysaccharide biosynthesis C-terminal domain-containing protein n=1 Tax=Sandaracinobacteroides sayramensis TaxID=2913411 RepID=UPI001EDA62D0|nr:NAD-dependent epimerase/dehydratase family protein [Sandaracinobacteroides sayramensis]MCG2841189.1 NAD-dependent epimerase/dehydratase family protein [Sandaracinobacteroides sayramensis]